MLIRSVFFSMAGVGKINEDSFACEFLDDGSCIAAVADGVGGNYGGSIASALATQTAVEAVGANPKTPLSQVVATTSSAIRSRGNEDLISGQMATTLSLCVIQNDGVARVAHVGDSRIYHLRGNGIVQRTKDQTEVAALVEAGILSREQAKTYPRRTVLRSALSAKGVYETFETEFTVLLGDRLVLLTDGAYRLVTKAHLRNLSLEAENIDDLLQTLKREIEGENDDDATIVIVDFSPS